MAGAPTNARDIALCDAILRFDEVSAVALIQGGGLEEHFRARCGLTALMLAAEGGMLSVVDALLACHTPETINLVDCCTSLRGRGTQRTALHYASMRGHLDVVKALLGAGSDISARDSNGALAEDVACAPFPGVASYLHQWGAASNHPITDNRGEKMPCPPRSRRPPRRHVRVLKAPVQHTSTRDKVRDPAEATKLCVARCTGNTVRYAKDPRVKVKLSLLFNSPRFEHYVWICLAYSSAFLTASADRGRLLERLVQHYASLIGSDSSHKNMTSSTPAGPLPRTASTRERAAVFPEYDPRTSFVKYRHKPGTIRPFAHYPDLERHFFEAIYGCTQLIVVEHFSLYFSDVLRDEWSRLFRSPAFTHLRRKEEEECRPMLTLFDLGRLRAIGRRNPTPRPPPSTVAPRAKEATIVAKISTRSPLLSICFPDTASRALHYRSRVARVPSQSSRSHCDAPSGRGPFSGQRICDTEFECIAFNEALPSTCISETIRVPVSNYVEPVSGDLFPSDCQFNRDSAQEVILAIDRINDEGEENVVQAERKAFLSRINAVFHAATFTPALP